MRWLVLCSLLAAGGSAKGLREFQQGSKTRHLLAEAKVLVRNLKERRWILEPIIHRLEQAEHRLGPQELMMRLNNERYTGIHDAHSHYRGIQATNRQVPFIHPSKARIPTQSSALNRPYFGSIDLSEEMKRQLRDGKVVLLSDSVVPSNFQEDKPFQKS